MRIDLHIPHARSLKDRRQVLRKVTDQLRGRFPVSVAEVGEAALWQRSAIGVAMVSGDRAVAESVLRKAEEHVVGLGICEVTDARMEVVPW